MTVSCKGRIRVRLLIASRVTRFCKRLLHLLNQVVFYWDQSFVVGWGFSYSIRENHFSVGLLARLFQLASKQVAVIIPRDFKSCITTAISRSCSDSTENGWKRILLRNVIRINPKWLRLKLLIQTEHDLKVVLRPKK